MPLHQVEDSQPKQSCEALLILLQIPDKFILRATDQVTFTWCKSLCYTLASKGDTVSIPQLDVRLNLCGLIRRR